MPSQKPGAPKPPATKPNPPLKPITGQPPGLQGSYGGSPKPAPPKLPKPPAREEFKNKSFIGKFKKGGKVKKTGVALVHKGEEVITAKKAKKHKRIARKHYASKG